MFLRARLIWPVRGPKYGPLACKVRQVCRLPSLTWLPVVRFIDPRQGLSASVVVGVGGQLHVGGGDKLTGRV